MNNNNFLKKVKTNPIAEKILFLLLIYLNLLAIAHLSRLRGLYQTFGEGILPVLVACATGWLLHNYRKIESVRIKVFSFIGGGLLAITHVYGMYLHYKNNLFTDAGQFLLQLLVVAGMMILTVPLFALLLTGLDKARDWWQTKLLPTEQKTPKLLFLKYWGIIFACYLPLFLHWWPVNFIFDAKYQMQEVIGNYYKIHHPLLHTLLMGYCYKLGDTLGSVSLGMSFYTIIQMLILTAAFAYTMVYLYQKRIPKIVRLIVLLSYALFPMHAIFSITATKDVLFAAFFLFFFVLVVKLCFHQEPLTWQKAVGLLVSGILMILFRRNALYALLLTLPFLLWARKGGKKKCVLAALLLGCVLLSDVINNGVIKAVNATTDDSLQESMSVPMQQIARVVNYRGAELDEALYNELLMYWDAEVFTTYNPYLSDPIKNNVNRALLEENVVNFLKLWTKIGLKFPGEYLESFLTNTLGFWYLGDLAYAVDYEVAIYHTLIDMGEEIEKVDLFPPAAILYDDLFYLTEYKDTPILSYSFQSCVYFWLLIIFALFAIYRKDYKKLLPAMLLFTYMASCFLGPGVFLRYIYCIVVSVPIIILLAFHKSETS